MINEKKRIKSHRYELPQYWISLQTNGTRFLDRMEEIIKNNSSLIPSRYKQSFMLGEVLDRLSIEIGDAKYYRDLNIIVWVESKNKRIVGIDARASWMIKDPPPPELYSKLILKFFSPFLGIYNKQFNASLHLEQGNLYTGRSNLPSQAATLFKRFTAFSLRPYKPPDWDSLYHFIRHCHACKVKLSTHEFMHFLREAGFSETSSRQITRIYAHGRNILSYFNRDRTYLQVYYD